MLWIPGSRPALSIARSSTDDSAHGCERTAYAPRSPAAWLRRRGGHRRGAVDSEFDACDAAPPSALRRLRVRSRDAIVISASFDRNGPDADNCGACQSRTVELHVVWAVGRVSQRVEVAAPNVVAVECRRHPRRSCRASVRAKHVVGLELILVGSGGKDVSAPIPETGEYLRRPTPSVAQSCLDRGIDYSRALARLPGPCAELVLGAVSGATIQLKHSV